MAKREGETSLFILLISQMGVNPESMAHTPV